MVAMTLHIDPRGFRDLWADQNLSVPGIAARLGVSVDTVRRRAIAWELPPRRPQWTARRSSAEIAAERDRMRAHLVELWADPDLPLADIAARMGMDRETTRRWATRLGLPAVRRPRRRNPARSARKAAWRARLPELWADPAMTIPQIAATLGMHRVTVSQAAAEMGLPQRPRGPRRAKRE